MKAGAALTSWLADPARQSRTLAGINDFARREARRPVLSDLKRGLSVLDRKTPETVGPLIEHFFSREAELQSLVDALVGEAAAEPFFRPPFPRIDNEIASGLLIFEDPAVFIALNVIDVGALALKKIEGGGAGSLNFTGTTTYYHFLRGGDATFSFWEAPEIEPGFTIDTSGRCRKTGERRIKDDETLLIDGRRESFVIEHAKSDMVFLYATLRPEQAPVALEYDSRSLACIGASSIDEASSRIQMMITLLRMMDRADAAPLFAEALKSPYFFTRWHVMREFLALDADAALPHLKAMAEGDPHPDCRAAARQTLDAFFSHEEAA